MTFTDNGSDYPSRVGFTYKDTDGDEVRVWKAGSDYPGGGIRISSTSVHVPAADIPKFLAEMQRVFPKPCVHCNGKGTV